MMKMIRNAVNLLTKVENLPQRTQRAQRNGKVVTLWLCGMLLLLTGCRKNCMELEPEICYFPQTKFIQALPSPFEKLSLADLRQEWGKELYVGLNFAHEMDLYRAITAFKRALIFLPADNTARKQQIQYNIVLSYYLGQKYQDALETFDNSDLITVPNTFPAFRELMIILFDSYQQTDQCEKAERVFRLLYEYDAETANQLLLSVSFQTGNLAGITALAPTSPNGELLQQFLDDYSCAAKSVQKARNLNAILPGAGYYYVGQKKTAMTSFIINALFVGAAYYFIKNDNIPAGLITASLESGWYIGGINGAGLAAKEYNDRLYEVNAKDLMVQQRLFPVLMLEQSF